MNSKKENNQEPRSKRGMKLGKSHNMGFKFHYSAHKTK